MDTDILKQYRSLKKEKEDITRRIRDITKELDGHTQDQIKDMVRGGEAGRKVYEVEGTKDKSYSRRKTVLQQSKLRLQKIEKDLDEMLGAVEEEIMKVPSAEKRIIIRLHYQDGLSWTQTARELGPGYTGDAIRISTTRYLESIGRKNTKK